MSMNPNEDIGYIIGDTENCLKGGTIKEYWMPVVQGSLVEDHTEGCPFTIRNHPVKTQTFDFLYIFACNTSQMQFPCNIRLSLAYNHDKQILSGFL